MVHAPMLAAGPETTLAGVWARRADAAAELATRHGSQAFESLDALFDSCEAVAFAVPPDVQAAIAGAAARAGKALLLEKPIAGDLGGAEALAAAVGEAGVASMVVLTWRYAAPVRAFLDEAATFEPFGGRGHFVSGALLGGPFATPWRLERGPLVDLGPHVFDLLDAAIGRIGAVHAYGDPAGWVTAVLEHESGAVSDASMCATVPVPRGLSGVELYGSSGVLAIDCATAVGPETFATVRREFAALAADGGDHPLDVERGLHLQRLIDTAERAITG
jgi:predicted dehydrogenase